MKHSDFHVEVFDEDTGDKIYHIVQGHQTIAVVAEDLFENREEARSWAKRIAKALNNE